jgi:hypothetical protein
MTMASKFSNLLFKQAANNRFYLRNSMSGKNLRIRDSPSDWAPERKHEEHHVMISTMQNRVCLVHSNPFIGKIFVYELDPTT